MSAHHETETANQPVNAAPSTRAAAATRSAPRIFKCIKRGVAIALVMVLVAVMLVLGLGFPVAYFWSKHKGCIVQSSESPVGPRASRIRR
jgi:uncharacterized protein HemX